MEESVFTKIIRGEVPAYKVYEDDGALAFMDIHPAVPGHVLVVPKVQVDRLEDLEESDYIAFMGVVKKVMTRLVEVFGEDYRGCLRVVGFDVAHAHVHVVPCRDSDDFWTRERMDVDADHEELAKLAEKLKF